MAEAAGLDIASISGTGPQGRITKEDIEREISNKSSATPARQSEPDISEDEEQTVQSPVTGIRKVIATRMLDSLRHSAQLTLNLKADVTELLALQKQISEFIRQQYEVKLTITDFIARAAVLSLLQHKQMNSAYIDDRILTYSHVHLGIAVALDKGLVVPVIRHAEKRSLPDLSRLIKSLAQQSRDGQLGSEHMQVQPLPLRISALTASSISLLY